MNRFRKPNNRTMLIAERCYLQSAAENDFGDCLDWNGVLYEEVFCSYMNEINYDNKRTLRNLLESLAQDSQTLKIKLLGMERR